MGNAMQRIYATVHTMDIEEKNKESLRKVIQDLDNTLKTFKSLFPYEEKHHGSFQLTTIMQAVETLSRATIQLNKIKIKFIYDRYSETQLELPYQGLLQVILNIIQNSYKSFKENSPTNKYIVVEVIEDSDHLLLSVSDNGCGIPEESVDDIFKYRFTTTGGQGIGLYHAKYFCDKINGEITLTQGKEEEFTTTFTMKIPYKND